MKHNVTSVMKKHVSELFQILDQYLVTDRKTFTETAQSDLVFKKAVLMNIGYIGELSKKMGDGFKKSHPEISRRRLGTSRNIIFHEYDIVDMDIISSVVFKDITLLQKALDVCGN